MYDDVWAEQLVSGALGLRDRELDVINELLYLPRVAWSSAKKSGVVFKLCKCRARLAPDIGIVPLILALSDCISTDLGTHLWESTELIILGLGAFVLDYV